MKLKLVPSIIALALSALIAFGFYAFCRFADMKLAISIIGGVSMLLTLGALFGVSLTDARLTVNVKVLSSVIAFLLLIANIVFCCLEHFSLAVPILVEGILLLTWLIIVYLIAKS